MSSSPFRSDLVALCEAIEGIEDTDVKGAMVESVLSMLADDIPAAARLCATVLLGLGSEEGQALARRFLVARGHADVTTIVSAPAVTYDVDLLVLAIKPVELAACMNVFGIPRLVPPVPLGSSGLCGWFVEVGGRSVLISMAGGAGNVQAAMVVSAIRSAVNVKGAVLIGMAAGVEQMQLGDVVVAEAVYEYEFQKLTKDGALFAPRPYTVPDFAIQTVEAVTELMIDRWPERCRDIVRNAVRPEREKLPTAAQLDEWFPEVKRGVILAGSKLIEDGSLAGLKKAVSDRVRAAEMEGAGFAAACTPSGIPWLVVRGIADYGKHRREKGWQFPATVAAASFVYEAFKLGVIFPPAP